MENLKIEYLPVGSLKPYEKNAKKHTADQVEHIANSIREFGFRQPLVIDKDNVLVIGHGRLLAAKKLGLDTVPCVRADDLTDEQIKALRLADNKTNESEWDFDLLGGELDDIFDIDMDQFGFDLTFDTDKENREDEETFTYSEKSNIPQYEPSGDCPPLENLCDDKKYASLFSEIEESHVSDSEKVFLKKAASRHLAFDYKKIADYYANAKPEMQKLMEKSALVIIDINDAIKYNYAKLSAKIKEEIENE